MPRLVLLVVSLVLVALVSPMPATQPSRAQESTPLAGATSDGVLGARDNHAGTGEVPDPSPSGAPTEQWRFELGERARAMPLVAGDLVYIAGYAGTLHALDAATGEERWSVATGRREHNGEPAIVDGVIYFPGGDGLLALDVVSRAEIWRTEEAWSATSSVVVVDGVLYVAVLGSALYAFDAATGAQLCSARTGGATIEADPAVVDGTVYVGTSDGLLVALDAADGRELWCLDTEISFGGIQGIALVDGVAYASALGALFAVDAATGEERWRSETGTLGAPAVGGGLVYLRNIDAGALVALDTATREERWQFPIADPQGSSPVVAGSDVLIGAADGNLYAVDAANGEERWRVRTGGPVESSPAVVDGAVYVGSDDGALYAFSDAG